IDGSEEERAKTPPDGLSPLFAGGHDGWISSITALSAPLNGTTAYYAADDILTDENSTAEENLIVRLLYGVSKTPTEVGACPEDSATYDMHIDNALAMLDSFQTIENVYYYSLPCSCTDDDGNGVHIPDESITERMFRACGKRMGKYTGETPGGFAIDESWRENDGLVNTVSARAPLNAPQKDYDETSVEPGVWNVLPTYRGCHTALMGNLLIINNVRELYVDLLMMIAAR
ncbi:MAG: hypothetical protein K6C36_00120, partial [Clostridia bacterium]|nr:hypothetical protein [Clostridia bacterium]